MTILHPYAQKLRNGMPNPKNPPDGWWTALMQALRLTDVVQVGVNGETPLVKDFRAGLPLAEIERLVRGCDYWLAVDSFLPHLAHHIGKPGVVIWSASDPRIFGYPENLNLLKDRAYLRQKQFRTWEEQSYVEDAFLRVSDAARQTRVWARQERAA